MVNLSTPHPELHSILWSEFNKCAGQVRKYINKQNRFWKQNALALAKKHMRADLATVEYKSPSGNRWINYLYAQYAGRDGVAFGYDSICYWETYGSFGAFIPFTIHGEKCLVITSGHFWQRICERTDYKMQGVHTAMKFFGDHRSCRPEILSPEKGDTRNRVALYYSCGTAYGYEVNSDLHIFEIRTFINKDSMTGKKLRDHQRATANLASEDTINAYDSLRAASGMNPTGDTFSVIDHLDKHQQVLLEQHMQKEGAKEMERQLAELRKTISDEAEVIEQYVRNNPVTYYVNRHGKHVKTDDPNVCKTYVRLRISECERLAAQEQVIFCEAMCRHMNTEISQNWQSVFNDVFSKGYQWGWAATYNWLLSESQCDDGEQLQDFKHKTFLQFKTAFDQSLSDHLPHAQKGLMHYFATFGFDRGFSQSFAILAEVYNLPYHQETTEEYVSEHCKPQQ